MPSDIEQRRRRQKREALQGVLLFAALRLAGDRPAVEHFPDSGTPVAPDRFGDSDADRGRPGPLYLAYLETALPRN